MFEGTDPKAWCAGGSAGCGRPHNPLPPNPSKPDWLTAAAHAGPIASPPSSQSRFIGQAEDMEFIPLEPRSLTDDPLPAETRDDALADVPLIRPVTDRFTIQPGEIELIVVGSIEVVIHPTDTDDPGDWQTRQSRTGEGGVVSVADS